MQSYWSQHERQLREIMESFGAQLTPEDQQEVQHFIDVNEHGVAFDTLTGILHERGIEVDQRRQIDALAVHLNTEGNLRSQ